MSNLVSALKAIRGKLPGIGVDDENYGVLSTGSIAADVVTVVGGFPRGRVSEVSGQNASAKTTLALSCAARAQKAGLHVTFLDVEQALDMEYATRLGADFTDDEVGVYLRPSTFENSAFITSELIEGNGTDLIVVDSVSAMLPESVFKNEAGGTEAVALRARHFSAWLPRLIQQTRAAKRHPAVVLINQLRDLIPTNQYTAKYAAKTTTTGGNAIKYYSSLRLTMKQVRKGYITKKADDPFRVGEEVEVAVANQHSVQCEKNKVGAAYKEAPLWVYYHPELNLWGIDNVHTLLDMALAAHLVEKNGKYYTVGDQKLASEEAAHAYLVDAPEQCQLLAASLGLDWAKYAPIGRG